MSRGLMIVLGAAALLLTACENKNDKMAGRTEDPNLSVPPPSEPAPTYADPYATDPMVRQTTPPPTARPAPPAGDTGTMQPPAEPKAKVGRTYVVQKGDTLAKIAKKVYGSEKRWKAIWDANRRSVPDPNKLKVGQKLVIP